MNDDTSPRSAPDDSPTGIARRRFLAGAAAAGAGAVVITGTGTAAAANRFGLPSSSERLHILVTGDAGTGKAPQFAVTDAARKIHSAKPFDAAVGLGDNIYESGPNGPDDVQFSSKFEKPNAGLNFPWLMALGNHDNTAIAPGDGGWLVRGDTEVAYHRRSQRWYMPSRYYSAKLGVADFFILDLNPLAAYIPPFLSPYWEPGGSYMTRQSNWLRAELRRSRAPWKFVCTHHPYLNNGPHGPAGRYDGLPAPLNGVHLKTFIEANVAGHAQFLLSGHDHSQQIFDPSPALKGTRQIVSGAASKSVTSRSSHANRARYENYTDRGFMTLDITPTTVALDAHEVSSTRGSRKAFSTTYRI